MPKGTGYRFTNRAPVLPQGPAIISGGDGHDAAFNALTVASSQLGAVAYREEERRIARAEAVYLAEQETQITKEMIGLRDQYRDDPAGFTKAVEAYKSATIQSVTGQPEFIVDRVGIIIDQRRNAQLSGISAARAAKEEGQARSVFNTRLEQAEEDVLNLASAGQAGSEEFLSAQQGYRDYVQEASRLGLMSEEQAALQIARIDEAAIVGGVIFDAEEIRKERGLDAALAFTERLKTDETSGLSTGTRLKLTSAVEEDLRSRDNSDKARGRSLRSAVNGLTERYRSGKPVTEAAYTETVDALRDAGQWQEIARLNQARAYGDLAQQANRLSSAEERTEFWQRTLEELREDGAYQNPIQGEVRLNDRFGMRTKHPVTGRSAMHNGIDIAAKEGEAVVSVLDGTVKFAGTKGGFGNIVIVQHADGTETEYAHLSEIGVKSGDAVNAGAPLGAVGSTGRSTGPHLHFGVKVGGKYVDPEEWSANQGGGDPGQTPLQADIQRALARELRAIWKPMHEQWKGGIRPTTAEINDVLEEAALVGAVDIIDQIEAHGLADDEIAAIEDMTLDERATARTALLEKEDSEGLTRIETAALQALTTLEVATAHAAKKDAQGVLIETGDSDAPATLDFSDPEALQVGLKQREAAAYLAEETFGQRSASIFRPHEVERLQGYYDTADANERARLLGSFASLDGHTLRAALAEIASDLPSFAIAAAMYAQNPAVATAIVRGETAIEVDKKLVPKDAFRDAFNERALGVFAGQPRRNNAMMIAVQARYADLINGTPDANQKEVNAALMDRAFADVVGNVGRDWSGNGFMLPPDMTSDEASNLLRNLQDDDLDGAVTVGGAPILASDLRDGNARLLENPTRPGTYYIDLAGSVLNDEGGLYILDPAEIAIRRPEALQTPAPETHFPPSMR